MIRRGDVLLGELRLPLTTRLTVWSDLETPLTRRVHRTLHRLEPMPRWTLGWVTLVAPQRLAERFLGIPSLLTGVEAVRLVASGVRLNPWSPPPTGGIRDHLDLLRIAIPAARVSRATGVPLSAQALVDKPPEPFIAEVLAGAGVVGILPRDAVADPVALGFTAPRAEMTRRIEGWLHALAATRPASQPATALILGDDAEVALASLAAVDEWNATWAFPKIELAGVAGTMGTTGAMGATEGFGVLARAVAPAQPTLQGVADRFRFPVAGMLVFNPSPFGRSDVATLPDGSLRIATDVPGLGYALVTDTTDRRIDRPTGGSPSVGPSTRGSVATQQFSVRLDADTGAIVSLVEQATGTELVAPGDSLNALDGSVASEITAEELPGVGARLVARRVTATGVVQSVVYVYDTLPWVDIQNLSGGCDPTAAGWGFGFAEPSERVSWEVAGGRLTAAVPVEQFTPLRWVALHGAAATIMVGRAVPGTATLTANGRLTLHAPANVRFRVAVLRATPLPDDPWRFGFGMLPFLAVPASGRGDRDLRTFGRMFDVADPLVAVVGIGEADAGAGVILWLLDLGGPARDIAIRPGLLTFDGGRLIDLTERDRGPAVQTSDGAILVPIEGSGYAAVRLLGVRSSG
jgi:hypothetical protein